jgi:hypothetical protein
LCIMFVLQPNIIHISKDDAYDDNYNVTKFIYQVIVNVNNDWNGLSMVKGLGLLGKINWKALKILSLP